MRTVKDKRIFSHGNRVIYFGNCTSIDKPKCNRFRLAAYIGEIANNIRENYQSPDNEDEPGMLCSDFLYDIEDWFKTNIPGYKVKLCREYITGLIWFIGEPVKDKAKLKELKRYLTNWIENCYSYAW